MTPPRDALDVLRADYPGWKIYHHITGSGTDQWVAHRRGEPTSREVAAGLQRYLEGSTALDLYGLLAGQVELLHCSSASFTWEVR